MPPSVACSTLATRVAHTTKKPVNHRLGSAFSGMCCTKGTRQNGRGAPQNLTGKGGSESGEFSFIISGLHDVVELWQANASRDGLTPSCRRSSRLQCAVALESGPCFGTASRALRIDF